MMRAEALSAALARCGSDWRAQLKEAARSPAQLLDYGVISPEEAEGLGAVVERYELLVSPYYLSLIDPSDPSCPIRRQAIPSPQELIYTEGESRDPIGDKAFSPTPILVHRYPDRALLFPTYRCPMFCRYCFRKDTLNSEQVRLHSELPSALGYLDEHPEIEEVILSGGDPLMLSNERLGELLAALDERGRRVRLHSRFPVTLPQRIDEQLVARLASVQRLNFVTHFNHPRELSEPAREALTLMRRAGLQLYNQSVLLGGVNDRVETLSELFTSLLDLGVSPHYLHHPDLTEGTQHLRVSLRRGLELTRALRGRLTGLAIPRYVIDIPHGGGKVLVDSSAVEPSADPRRWLLHSPITGEVHSYTDLAEPS